MAGKITSIGSVLLCALALGTGSQPAAFAQENECPNTAAAIVEQAYPDARQLAANQFFSVAGTITLPGETLAGDPHAIVCRLWPANPQYLLVAVPLIHAKTVDETQGDLDLLVLDSETLAILGRSRIPSMMEEDAIRIRQLRFDTAFYALAPGGVAFGLRLTQQGSSRVNPFHLTTLWLYDLDGEQPRLILDNIVVESSGGEWDGTCAGEFWQTRRILAMAPETNDAIADIVVTTEETATVSEIRNGQCADTEMKTERTTDRLAFDGQRYGVPQHLARGW